MNAVLFLALAAAIGGLVKWVRQPVERTQPNPPTPEEAEQRRRDLIAKYGHPVSKEEPIPFPISGGIPDVKG